MTLHFIHIKPGFRFILNGSVKAAVRKEVASMGKKKTYRGELVDEIRGLGQSQGLNHVFTTFWRFQQPVSLQR